MVRLILGACGTLATILAAIMAISVYAAYTSPTATPITQRFAVYDFLMFAGIGLACGFAAVVLDELRVIRIAVGRERGGH